MNNQTQAQTGSGHAKPSEITVNMNVIGEHNPPHFHAYYGEYKATFLIDSLELQYGDLLRRQLRLVQAWAEIHQEELRADWKLAMNGEEPCRISPLQ